jgi:hypothetical protein
MPSFSLLELGFSPEKYHTTFMVEQEALKQVFFPVSSIFPY